MPMDTHTAAPNRYIEANGVRYAYRRFATEGGVPLLFLQHFRGGMDHWDPLVTDGLAEDRPVILVDNAGVGGSSGTTADTIEAMAEDLNHFLTALDVERLDVLGFSIGGTIAQSIVLRNPCLVRRLVLVGTRPRGGESSGGRGRDPEVARVAGNPTPTLEDFLFLFFDPSPESQAAGRNFWDRRHERTIAVDPPSSPQAAQAQSTALRAWYDDGPSKFDELKRIAQPTLVVHGHRDIMLPTVNAYNLSQHIPDAQLIIYPKSGHGALFQYPTLFVQHTKMFLDG
jgi:pimeloyl-ACP methyl ester carboxylesterase